MKPAAPLILALSLAPGWIGSATRQAAGIGGPMGMLAFHPGFEEEADLLGIQSLYTAGYDPAEMVTVFERMNSQARKQPGAIAKLFATHPATGDRVTKTQKNKRDTGIHLPTPAGSRFPQA